MKVGEHPTRPTDQVGDKVEYSLMRRKVGPETLNLKLNTEFDYVSAMADIVFHLFDRMCET